MIKDLRKKTDVELGELISKLKIQLLEMRFKMASGEVEGLHKISEIKKTIAMAMTVLSERNIDISFSTHSIQLIKRENNKQHITALKLENLVADNQAKNVGEKTTTSTQTSNKPQNNNQSNVVTPNNTNNLKTSSNKQPVQIRRSAKG